MRINRKRKIFYLLIVLSCFVIARLIFIFFSPHAFCEEEIKTGSLGYDLLTGGLKIPFWGYLDSPHSGGSIFAALTAIPFSLVFGKIDLSLKLTALAFSLATGAIVFLVLFPRYKRSVIFPFFLFFVVSTPHYLQKSVVLMGNVVEPIFFVLLSLVFIEKIFIKKEESFFNFALLGFICGFGLWIQYVQFGVIITLFIIWFLKDRLFFTRKVFLVFLVFFLFGLFPFIAYNWEYKLASFTADFSINTTIANTNIQIFLRRLIFFFVYWLPQSFHIIGWGSFSSRLLSYFFYLIILGSIGYLVIWKKAKKKEFGFAAILFLYLGVTVFIISLGNFHIGSVPKEWGSMYVHDHYYLVFLQPFIFILASIGLSELFIGKKKERFLGWGISFLIFVTLTIGFLRAVTPAQSNAFLFHPMHDTSILVYEAGLNYSLNPKVFAYFLKKIDQEFRSSYFVGAGAAWNNIIEEGKIEENLDILKEELELMSDEERLIFFNFAIKGEPYFRKNPSYQSFLELSRVLGVKDRMILKEALRGK